jgi:hypothetical protein
VENPQESKKEKEQELLTIYLPWVLCLSYSCHIPVVLSVVVAERGVILFVLVIKLTKETRRRV